MAEKNRLGRNLDVLLGNLSSATLERVQPRAERDLRTLPVDLMQRGKYQPRREIMQEALQELADSIRAHGVIQPIIVRAISRNQYEIIAGERRWRAAQLAGLSEVPVVIRDISDESAMALALIENIQREDLNPIEEAVAIKRLLDEFSMTHQVIAESIGKSRATVTNLLRLLELHPSVKESLEQGRIEMGHARALLTLTAEQQKQASQHIIEKDLSVRATEEFVRHLQSNQPALKKKTLDPNVRHLQQQLSERLSAPVKLQYNAKGKGKLIVQYNTLDELEGILERIK